MSKNIVLRGKAYWAKVLDGNPDEYGDKVFYKISLSPDDESVSKFNKSGMTLKYRELTSEEPDVMGWTFRRDVEGRTFKDKKTGKEKTLGGGAPRVVDAEGNKWDTDVLIGNGSTVEILVSTYQTKTKPIKTGHRLEAVKVIDLVQYEAPFEDDDDHDDEEVRKEERKSSKGKLPF